MPPPPPDRRRKRAEGKRAAPESRKPRPRRGWGSVARRGAQQVDPGGGARGNGRRQGGGPQGGGRQGARAGSSAREPSSPRPAGPPEPWEPEQWLDEPAPVDDAHAKHEVRDAARGAVRRGRPRAPDAGRPDRPPRDRNNRAPAATAPSGRRPPSTALEAKLEDAARAYDRERYRDALRILRPLADRAPDDADVRELLGVTLYRLGRWREAIRHLEVYKALTGSVDENPVLADCHRAVQDWPAVDELWDELRRVSPGADVVAEGRIVAAGALADRGDVAGAIRLLGQGRMDAKRPRPHHLRMLYALGDLYERAGEVPRARDLFRRVAKADPEFADVAERLAALG